MTSSTNCTVTIQLLGKNYQISCPHEEREELVESARLLNKELTNTKSNSNVIGLERIAIMTALNLSHQLVKNQKNGSGDKVVTAGMQRLTDKISSAISQLNP